MGETATNVAQSNSENEETLPEEEVQSKSETESIEKKLFEINQLKQKIEDEMKKNVSNEKTPLVDTEDHVSDEEMCALTISDVKSVDQEQNDV